MTSTIKHPLQLQFTKRYLGLAVFVATLLTGAFAGKVDAWQSDNGDGTFTNPPLYADYPDPDIIRVGQNFYFATTTFVNSPGLTILQSQDLVNWRIVSHVVRRLSGCPQYNMTDGTAYRKGIWAPSLRYHDGTFYVVDNPNPSEHAWIYRAKNIKGPWQTTELNRSAFDPGLFFDTNGTGYIVTSASTDGHVVLLKLNADYTKVVDARGIFYNKGVEGSKMIKRGKWYYIFNARPRDMSLMCSRASNIYGPYETVKSLNDARGGHQGAIVDLPDGRWYGFVMKDSGAVGRMTYISPIFWKDGWPIWGTPKAPGRVPVVARKPVQGKAICQPATSDDFSSPTLGLQWQWNHNPDNKRWSLSARPGFLRLRPTQATSFWTARNTLTQKGQGPWSRGEVKFDLSHLRPGDVCGFGTLGKVNGRIAVHCGADGKLFLRMKVTVNHGKSEMRVADVPIHSKKLFLRTDLDFKKNRGACAYSVNGVNWMSLGGSFDLAFDWRTGTFQGEQYAMFCYNSHPGDGYVDVDWFHFSDSKGERQ